MHNHYIYLQSQNIYKSLTIIISDLSAKSAKWKYWFYMADFKTT